MTAIYSKGLDPRDPLAHNMETQGQAARLGAPPKKFRSSRDVYRDLLRQEIPGSDERPLSWLEARVSPELRAQLKIDADRLAKHPVAYVDATFSAPKSVSMAYASFSRYANEAIGAGRYAEAAVWSQRAADVERAVMDGARASVDFLQERAGYGRVGHHGKTADGTNSGRWIDAHTFAVAMFLQHDSRAGDPQLHVHCAILNRQRCADGQWRALDTKAIHKWRGGAAAVGERAMEASATLSMGLRWVDRPDGNGRELVGVGQDVIDAYSTRTRVLGPLAAQWVTEWEARQGRPAPAKVRNDIRIAAALQSRAKKSKNPPTAEQQFNQWGDTYAQKVGGELVELAQQIIDAAAAHDEGPGVWSVPDVIERTLTRLEAKQGLWSYSDVMRAVSAELPANLGRRPDEVVGVLVGAANAVWNACIELDDSEPTAGLPPAMLLDDGRSSYEAPAGRRRTSAGILGAEHDLRAAVTATGARVLGAEQVQAGMARAVTGRTLGADQEAFIRGVLTSDSAIVHLVAPAGTGKSYALGALADAWATSGGRVFGTATSQKATDELAANGLAALNVTQWLAHGEQLGPDDLVILDEYSMTPVTDQLAIAQRGEKAGARVVFAGDPFQMGTVGGSSLAHDLPIRGMTFELSQVRRFANEWEAAASLGLRQGDPRVIDTYAAHGRIIDGGTLDQTQRMLVRGYLADRAAGLDTVLIAQTNEHAAQLSSLARAHLVAAEQVTEQGVAVAYGNIAGVGDVIEARDNNWRLLGYCGNTTVPINRTQYTVTGTHDDGGLVVTDAAGLTLTLPGDYVAQSTVLGYGRTDYSVEGGTWKTSWNLATETTRRAELYVGMSRGQLRNHAGIVTQAETPEAPSGEAARVERRDARGVVAGILAGTNDDGPEWNSPTLYNEHHTEVRKSLLASLDRLGVEVDMALAGRTPAILDRLAETGALTDGQRTQLASDTRALGELDRRLRQAEIAGHDAEQVLARALTQRDLAGVRDVGRVLAARLRADLRGQLQPKIDSAITLVPPMLRTNPRFAQLAAAADERFAELGERAVTERPRWLTENLGPAPADVLERLDYERRAGLVAGWRELADHTDPHCPIGGPPHEDSAHRQALWQAAHTALGQPDAGPAEAECSDAQLRAAVDRWRREDAVGPKYVAKELEAAHHTERENRVNASHWETAAARAEHTHRQTLLADAARARDAAQAASAAIPDLERRNSYRGQWYVATAPLRDAAHRAQSEAAIRGINLDDTGDAATEPAPNVTSSIGAARAAVAQTTATDGEHPATRGHDQRAEAGHDLSDCDA